jgi:Flp pilus assembly protein TadD
LGVGLQAQGRLEDAVAAYREAVRLKPDYPAAYINLGVVLGSKGRWDEAVAAYREAVRLRSDDAGPRLYHGIALSVLGRWDEAVAELREATRLRPDFPEAHYRLGIAFGQNGRAGEAVAAYREAVRLKPDFPVAQNNLAWRLATGPDPAARDPRQAVAHAERAVALAPTVGGFWTTLGVARYRVGDWAGAVEALTKAAEFQKGGTRYDFFFLAMAHWQLGAAGEARAWYGRAVAWMDEHKPQDEELRRFRAEAAELLGVLAPPPRPADRP